MPGWHTSKTGSGRGAGCNVPARLDGLFADALTQEDIRVVEILEKLGEERLTIGDDGFLDAFEDSAVHALRLARFRPRRALHCEAAMTTSALWARSTAVSTLSMADNPDGKSVHDAQRLMTYQRASCHALTSRISG